MRRFCHSDNKIKSIFASVFLQNVQSCRIDLLLEAEFKGHQIGDRLYLQLLSGVLTIKMGIIDASFHPFAGDFVGRLGRLFSMSNNKWKSSIRPKWTP